MIVSSEHVDVPAPGGAMRTLLARPRASGRFPGVVFYSDIFQLTGPMVRSVTRLAGYGYVVAAPEIYHRLERPGTALPFDDAGRDRGLADAARTSVAEFDADRRAALEFLAAHAAVAPRKLAAAGFCIGGHLAFRAALDPEVCATACFYATGLHDGALGKDADAGSLARTGEIAGEVLLVFGSRDPHTPPEGVQKVENALVDAGTRFKLRRYAGEHTFMRDEGARYDPELADLAWADMIALFRRVLGSTR
jgi:carboxymethylenebutenolidase